LTAHITLALRLQHRFSILERHTDLLTKTFDRMEEGIIVVDARGTPLAINLAAEQLLAARNGIAFGAAGLSGATKASTEKLRQGITRAATPMIAEVTRLHLPRRPPQPPLLADILPLGQLGLSSPGSAPPSVVVLLREPNESAGVDRAAIMEFYQLTTREAEVAALLAAGMTVQMIARKLNLANGTVRNHLKRVFEKTDTHSQVALLAVLRSFGA
jgi:DNA-binding NarL/FixJ family response regulator